MRLVSTLMQNRDCSLLLVFKSVLIKKFAKLTECLVLEIQKIIPVRYFGLIAYILKRKAN